ncbi:MAG TPA: hypothetical protein VK886_00630 [Vicinamibacterales bacterium]|nr:hypothetical protein [Vicinamibacterales bacterium]
MNNFSKGRRAFTAALGGLLAVRGMTGLAGGGVRLAEKVSGQTPGAALPPSGETLTDTQIERTRRAMDMLSQDLETVRRYAVPHGVEPATHFRAR